MGPISQKDFSSSLLGKIFIGTIESIINPNTTINGYTHKTYKFKVNIPVLHSDLKDLNSLPMFSLLKPIFRGSTSTTGFFGIPQVGSKVAVMFDGGNEKSGFVFAELLDSTSLLPSSPNIWGWEDEYKNIYNVDGSGDISLVCTSKYSITANNTITINYGSSTIVINTSEIDITSPTIKLNGNVVISQNLTVTESSTLTGGASINNIPFNSHIHSAGTYTSPSGAVTESSGPPS